LYFRTVFSIFGSPKKYDQRLGEKQWQKKKGEKKEERVLQRLGGQEGMVSEVRLARTRRSQICPASCRLTTPTESPAAATYPKAANAGCVRISQPLVDARWGLYKKGFPVG
jgi:hypothetical protein